MHFRKANIDEIPALNELIRSSKAIWGYSEAFLDDFIAKWPLSQNHVESHIAIILEEAPLWLGFFSFVIKKEELELDHFFVQPDFIRQGIGKTMWQEAVRLAKQTGKNYFTLISDPDAEAFYRRMGAKKINTFESFPGRFVPLMRYELL